MTFIHHKKGFSSVEIYVQCFCVCIISLIIPVVAMYGFSIWLIITRTHFYCSIVIVARVRNRIWWSLFLMCQVTPMIEFITSWWRPLCILMRRYKPWFNDECYIPYLSSGSLIVGWENSLKFRKINKLWICP